MPDSPDVVNVLLEQMASQMTQVNNQLQQVLDENRKHDLALASIQQSLDKVVVDMGKIEERLEELNKVVSVSDGQDGLRTKVALLEQRVLKVEDTAKSESNLRWQVWLALGTTAVVAVAQIWGSFIAKGPTPPGP